MSAAAFADSPDGTASLAKLNGSFGDVETIRAANDPGAANPFYLDKPVTNCDHITLELSVTERSGWCGGNYYVYVKDAEGDWHHTGVFRLKEEKVNGQPYTYEIDLDKRETFVAVALWPADKGVDLTGDFQFSVYVKPDCITEYSNAIPKPHFNVGNVTYETIVKHFVTTSNGTSEYSLSGLLGWLILAEYSRAFRPVPPPPPGNNPPPPPGNNPPPPPGNNPPPPPGNNPPPPPGNNPPPAPGNNPPPAPGNNPPSPGN